MAQWFWRGRLCYIKSAMQTNIVFLGGSSRQSLNIMKEIFEMNTNNNIPLFDNQVSSFLCVMQKSNCQAISNNHNIVSHQNLHSKLIESIILLLSLTHGSLYQSGSVYSKCFHLSIIHCIPIAYHHIYSSCICLWINDNVKLDLRVPNVM